MIYATRLNSLKSRPELYFRSEAIGTLDLLRRAGEIEGLGALSLNYPEHFTAVSPRELLSVLETTHLSVDSLNIRFPEDPFGTGGFTNPSAHVRAAAVDLTRRAVDVCAELGGDHVIVWPAYDGFDYPFQDSYRRMFEHTVEGFAAVAAHDPQTRVGIEYKPWEPRKQSMLANMGEALLVVAQVGAPNLGVVMDYCHAQMANEHPPKAAALALAQDRLFGRVAGLDQRGDDRKTAIVFNGLRADARQLQALEVQRRDRDVGGLVLPHRIDLRQQAPRVGLEQASAFVDVLDVVAVEE